MELLAKQAADLAIRLRTLPPGAMADPETLDSLERLAMLVLKEVAEARTQARDHYSPGERRGMWPAMQSWQRDR